VPEKYGNWNSIYRRFRRWSASGVWESVAIALAETMAESGHYSIDSTSVRAHVSAAGGKGGIFDELLSARRAGSPVKFIVQLAESFLGIYCSWHQHVIGSNLSTPPSIKGKANIAVLLLQRQIDEQK